MSDLVIDGVHYESRPEASGGDPCDGCALRDNDAQCSLAGSQCASEKIIWVKATVDPLSDDHEALTFHPLDQKASNPKDAVGVRKAPLSVVPMGVVAEIGVGMLEGASKYGRHNYRGVGVRASVYFDATMRHLISWWEGEDLDPDSGMSHIAKALCSLAVLRDAQMQQMCEDDRPPRSEPFYPRLNEAAAQIVDKHADKKPYHYTLKDGK